MLKVKQAFDHGNSIDLIYEQTGIDPWFLHHIQKISELHGVFDISDIDMLRKMKTEGFSDHQISTLTDINEERIREIRKRNKILPTYKTVDTCAAEFIAETPYCYSTYETENEITPLEGKKIMILGGGPNRIGQGIEFDYCCVQAVLGLKEIGYKTIMVNCNPETVSTDFDISDRLYFEPLTFEDVMNIIDIEKPDGVLVQFGGQTPLNIAQRLKSEGVKIIGTDPDAIDLAENRRKFGKILTELNIEAPEFGTAHSIDEALEIANSITYPVLVRPSYVLGGRGMQIVYDDDGLTKFVKQATEVSGEHPILIDRFLEDAYEFDVDAVCDGESVLIGGIMQHIEEAGVHSGDSSCVIPAYSLSQEHRNIIKDYTERLAIRLNIKGLLNIQFAIKDNTIFTLEVNPRASRTIPFVSKVTNVPLARYAAQVSSGKKISELELNQSPKDLIAVKKPVFPFNKFPQQNIFLSPEMKSTGEVMGFGKTFGEAYFKAQRAAGVILPKEGNVFISVRDHDKEPICEVASELIDMGFNIYATSGTFHYLVDAGIVCSKINKVKDGHPHIVDMIKNNEVHLIINTTEGARSIKDSFSIRKEAQNHKISLTTTVSGAKAFCKAIKFIDDFGAQDLKQRHESIL